MHHNLKKRCMQIVLPVIFRLYLFSFFLLDAYVLYFNISAFAFSAPPFFFVTCSKKKKNNDNSYCLKIIKQTRFAYRKKKVSICYNRMNDNCEYNKTTKLSSLYVRINFHSIYISDIVKKLFDFTNLIVL